MKKLFSIGVVFLGLFLSFSASAVEYECEKDALTAVLKHFELSEEEFFKENGQIFFCRSKKAPYTEVFQWGDGSGLVGVEYAIKNGACVQTEAPYTGQDDGDLDIEWAQANCQDFEG